MTTYIVIGVILFFIAFGVGYFNALIRNREIESEWQEITYAGNSVEPNNIYICKRCNYKSDLNRHYCSNCGSLMKNGISYHCYSDKIDLSEWEDKE